MSETGNGSVLDLAEFTLQRGSFKVALKGLSFGIGSVILAGPNGSGKSSALAALAGLLPWTGAGYVCGHDIFEREGQASVGYLPQDPQGLEHMRVGDALRFAERLVARGSERASAMAEALGISELAGKRISRLSGGQRRLAYLAMAILHQPNVVLLDEPTAGIDANHRSAIRSVVTEIAKRSLVITASHLPDDIDHLGTRTIVMRHGSVVFDGSNQTIRELGDRLLRVGAGPVEAALASFERG